MNLFATVSLYGGGPGSGCNPEVGKCGHHALYHGTSVENALSILKYGFDTKRNLTKKDPEEEKTVSFTKNRKTAEGAYGAIDSFRKGSIVPGGGRGAVITVKVPYHVLRTMRKGGGYENEGEYQTKGRKFDRKYIHKVEIYDKGKKTTLRPR